MYVFKQLSLKSKHCAWIFSNFVSNLYLKIQKMAVWLASKRKPAGIWGKYGNMNHENLLKKIRMFRLNLSYRIHNVQSSTVDSNGKFMSRNLWKILERACAERLCAESTHHSMTSHQKCVQTNLILNLTHLKIIKQSETFRWTYNYSNYS